MPTNFKANEERYNPPIQHHAAHMEVTPFEWKHVLVLSLFQVACQDICFLSR